LAAGGFGHIVGLFSRGLDKQRNLFMKTFSAALAAAALLLAAAIPAQAGKIVTPMLYMGGTNQLVCIATNASSSTIKVKVKIIGNLGGIGNESCTLTANDTAGCAAFLNDNAGHCRISMDGNSNAEVREKVRGVMFNRLTTNPFTIETSVEAR
jgi:hypothetical protein